MKIFNLSVKELLKNKLYFSYFALGLALILAVICVLANYSKQIFDGFFTQFDGGDVLMLEMSELPSEPSVYDGLPVFARGEGITYDITLTNGDKSVYLPSYKGGLCIVSEGDWITPSILFPLFAIGNFSLKENTIHLSTELAEELGCKSGDFVTVGDKEYAVGRSIFLSTELYSFIIFDPHTDADEFTIMLPDADRLLEISEYLTPENFNDTEGLLTLCNGYRGLKAGMSIVMSVLSAVCVLYVFIFIGMYLSKRAEFTRILFRVGMRKTQLFACLCSVFALLCLVAGAVGYLLCVLLDILVEKWASDLLGMHVDEVNYIAYFAVCFVISAAASALALLLNILKMSSEGEVQNR